MIDQAQLTQLAQWLAKAACDYQTTEADGSKGRLVLSLDHISQAESQEIQSLLMALGSATDQPAEAEQGRGDRFAPYYQQIQDCKLYKPKNPALAIAQVAKTNGLDVAELRGAFKAFLQN
jgi:hypothetical protein